MRTPGLGFFFAATLAINAQAAQWQALPESAPVPADNPTSAAKIMLGKTLFMDPRLSSTGTVSCNSCHNVMKGGDDSRAVSMGVHGQTGGRSAPTVWNAAFYSVQFWDGRANTLEDQAKGPIANPIEMGMPDLEAAVERLRAIPGYTPLFRAAFGKGKTITGDNLVKAIADFERTLITPNSPYDRFVTGDKTALTAQQQRGMQTFASLGCTACHSGPAFSGPSLPVGTGFFQKFPTFTNNAYITRYKLADDLGRYQVTQAAADKHMFRVPTLRNITHTAPYFHNGAVKTLDEAVRVMAKTQLNRDLSASQVADIAVFLQSLGGPYPEIIMPRLPASTGHSLVGN